MLSVAMQIRICMTRGIQRLAGDMSLFWTSILGLFFMALIIGSVFYDLPESTSSFYSRGALLFFAILMNAMNSEVGSSRKTSSSGFAASSKPIVRRLRCSTFKPW
jgi:hypothetical protein